MYVNDTRYSLVSRINWRKQIDGVRKLGDERVCFFGLREVTGDRRKLHNEKFHNLYSASDEKIQVDEIIEH